LLASVCSCKQIMYGMKLSGCYKNCHLMAWRLCRCAHLRLASLAWKKEINLKNRESIRFVFESLVVVEASELIRCLLGAIWGVQCSLWEPPKLEKYSFVSRMITLFARAVSRYCEALDHPVGAVLARLGPIWSQNGPRE